MQRAEKRVRYGKQKQQQQKKITEKKKKIKENKRTNEHNKHTLKNQKLNNKDYMDIKKKNNTHLSGRVQSTQKWRCGRRRRECLIRMREQRVDYHNTDNNN